MTELWESYIQSQPVFFWKKQTTKSRCVPWCHLPFKCFILVLLRASTVGKNKWDNFCFDIFLGFHSAQFSDKSKIAFTWMIYIRYICLPQGGGESANSFRSECPLGQDYIWSTTSRAESGGNPRFQLWDQFGATFCQTGCIVNAILLVCQPEGLGSSPQWCLVDLVKMMVS